MAVSLAASNNPNYTGERGPATQRASQVQAKLTQDASIAIQKDFDANMI